MLQGTEIIDKIWDGKQFLFFHSLHIKQELDQVEKVRWKAKRKNRAVENMRLERKGIT